MPTHMDSALSLAVLNSAYAGVGALAPTDLPVRPGLTYVTTFQSGSGWSLEGAGASFDAADHGLGTQSVKMVTPGTGAQSSSGVFKTGLPPIDLTNRMLAFLIKIEDQSALHSMVAYVGTGGFTAFNYITFANGWARPVDPTIYQMHDNEWTWVYFDPAVFDNQTGVPNLAAITDFKVRTLENTYGPASAHIQAIAHFPKPASYPKGVVTFTFDDSYLSHYTKAAPTLDKYGYGGEAFLIVDQLGLSNRMTLAQVHELEDKHSWEVGAHSYTLASHAAGYPSLSDADLFTDMTKLKNFLRSEGFRGADFFAWPLGQENAATAAKLRKFFSVARHVNGKTPAPTVLAQPMRMQALTVTASSTPASIQAKIDTAYAQGLWLQLILHDIVDSGAAGSTQYNVADLDTVAAYCSTKGIPVRTVGHVIRALNGASTP